MLQRWRTSDVVFSLAYIVLAAIPTKVAEVKGKGAATRIVREVYVWTGFTQAGCFNRRSNDALPYTSDDVFACSFLNGFIHNYKVEEKKNHPPDLGMEPRWLAAESGPYNIGLPPNARTQLPLSYFRSGYCNAHRFRYIYHLCSVFEVVISGLVANKQNEQEVDQKP